jgi:hypothetical protein
MINPNYPCVCGHPLKEHLYRGCNNGYDGGAGYRIYSDLCMIFKPDNLKYLEQQEQLSK